MHPLSLRVVLHFHICGFAVLLGLATLILNAVHVGQLSIQVTENFKLVIDHVWPSILHPGRVNVAEWLML